MPDSVKPPTDNNPTQRLSAYSDCWARYLEWGVRYVPWWLDPILTAFYCGLFYLLASELRQGVLANLHALFPKSPAWINVLRGYRVFWNFACIAVDGVRAKEQPFAVDWEICGLENFAKLEESAKGVVIVTAHMGNYDLAGPVFADRFHRTIHAVRAPERNAGLQRARQEALKHPGGESYRIAYNEPGNMLALTLAQALIRGDAVAIQADRVLFEVSAVSVAWEDWCFDVPQGPFVLAQTTNCPLMPLFIIRVCRGRYRVEIGELFHCDRIDRDRAAGIQRAAMHWAALLGERIKRYWYQWLVVEQVLRRKEDSHV